MKFPTSDDRAAAQILNRLVALSQDAIVVTAPNGCVQAWSPGAERIFGVTRDEMSGRPLTEYFNAESGAAFTSRVAQLKNGDVVHDLALGARNADGQPLDLVVDITPFSDTSERVTGVLIIARDVTASRRTEAALVESEGRWSAIIASAVDAMIVIDQAGIVEVFNPAAERLFGFSANEVIGRNVSMLMPPSDGLRHDAYIDSYIQTGQRKIIGIGRQITARRRDGSTFPAHLSVGEMSIDGRRHFTGILHDLSSRVRLESQLREQTALARLGEMAAVIAHEVKNPLAAVRGAIQVVGGRLPAGSKDTPVIAEIVGRIDALDDLIKDLLLFARTPTPRLAKVEVGSLLRLVTDFLAADPAMHGVAIHIEGTAPPLDGDAELLRIVFQNLVLNAGQAMHGQGQVDITLSDRGNVQQVVVVDNGPGLSSEAIDNLFRPFFTTKARGTGLGLPTAKRLVELHGGTIDLTSQPGRGTQVTITLPTQASRA